MNRAPLSESDFERQHVEPLASLHGWRWAHFQDSRHQVRPGVFVGDTKSRGWPDLAICRERVIFAELKSEGGPIRRPQIDWLDALATAGAECYLWRPSDLEELGRILTHRWRYLPRGDRTPPVATSEAPVLMLANGEKIAWTPGSLWIAGHGRFDV